jgi:predicted enzyme related to lactoylglutathione lyase
MNNEHHNNGLDYIEFNVSDISRTKEFYGQAFGWTFTDYGPDYCEFSDGQRKGGFASKVGEIITNGPLVVLFSIDLNQAMTNVKKAGGLITKPVFSFPGGERFHFTDPQGYELAVWRPFE